MRKHLILLIIGLLALCALFCALRGCNEQNTPAWVMRGIRASSITGIGDGKTADQKADDGQEAASTISQTPAPASTQKADQPAQASKAPEEASAATIAPSPSPAATTAPSPSPAATIAPSPAPTATTAPSSAPTATAASQNDTEAATAEQKDNGTEESNMPDTAATNDAQAPESTQGTTPSPTRTDPDAAPLPNDTTVMDGDTAERAENGTAFERDLFNTRPMIRGEDVKQVQIALNARGFRVGEADGIFGPKTEQAVKTYQLYHGIHGMNDEAYGHVDETTWNWLF